jgi:hypothetical protein
MAGSSQRRLLAEFVAVTGYVTTAERPLDPALLLGLDDYSPGSMVFPQTASPDGPAWLECLVDLGTRRVLAPAARPRHRPDRTRVGPRDELRAATAQR